MGRRWRRRREDAAPGGQAGVAELYRQPCRFASGGGRQRFGDPEMSFEDVAANFARQNVFDIPPVGRLGLPRELAMVACLLVSPLECHLMGQKDADGRHPFLGLPWTGLVGCTAVPQVCDAAPGGDPCGSGGGAAEGVGASVRGRLAEQYYGELTICGDLTYSA